MKQAIAFCLEFALVGFASLGSIGNIHAQEIALPTSAAESENLSIEQEKAISEQLNPMLGSRRTRFGNMPMSAWPGTLDRSHSRVPQSVVYGRNNRILGIDNSALNSRIKPLESAREPLLPSDYLSENVSSSDSSVPSANTIAPAAIASSTPTPIRRPVGFFERPGVMADFSEPPALLSEESIARSSIEQRWFRDIGRRADTTLSPLHPSPDDSRDVLTGGLEQGGPAVAIGGREMSGQTAASGIDPREQFVQNRQELLNRQAAAKKNMERSLENLLLSSPAIHLLSPVQVSFQNGIATVRGVVPSQQHKVAAGNILLGNPSVRQVNNLMSIVPADPNTLSTPIEPKN